MKKNCIQPAQHIVALQHQSHLLIDSIQKLNNNADLEWDGATIGDVESRTKENEWEDIWDE